MEVCAGAGCFGQLAAGVLRRAGCMLLLLRYLPRPLQLSRILTTTLWVANAAPCTLLYKIGFDLHSRTRAKVDSVRFLCFQMSTGKIVQNAMIFATRFDFLAFAKQLSVSSRVAKGVCARLRNNHTWRTRLPLTTFRVVRSTVGRACRRGSSILTSSASGTRPRDCLGSRQTWRVRMGRRHRSGHECCC